MLPAMLRQQGRLEGIYCIGWIVLVGGSVAVGALGSGRESIESVLKQHTDQLLSLPGVVGTAISECEGKPCIKVLVVKETPELMAKIPRTLEGYPVVLEETGEIRPLPPR